MAKRHKAAIDIQDACNPSGVAHAIIAAMQEFRESPDNKGTASLCKDHAIKLMVFQLAYLCGVSSGVANFSEGDWSESYEFCKKNS